MESPKSSVDINSEIVTLGELERKYIERALILTGKNKTAAAEKLGITLKTLYNKLHAYEKADQEAALMATKEE